MTNYYYSKYMAEGKSFAKNGYIAYIEYNGNPCLYNSDIFMVYRHIPKFDLYAYETMFEIIEREDIQYKIMTEDACNESISTQKPMAYLQDETYFLQANDGEVVYMTEGGVFALDNENKFNKSQAKTVELMEVMQASRMAEEALINKLRENGKISKEKF